MNTWDEERSDPSEISGRRAHGSLERSGPPPPEGAPGDGSPPAADGPWLPWRIAAERALYGTGRTDGADRAAGAKEADEAGAAGATARPDWDKAPETDRADAPETDRAEGFFVREAPAAHFRTSVHASPLFAVAVARLLCHVDATLGYPRELAMVDVGAGRGELLTGVLQALPDEVAARVRPYAVERAPRPEGLDERVKWSHRLPGPGRLTGLLFANEWLDDVPVDVAEADPDGIVRTVLVRPSDGAERLGEPVHGRDAEWLRRWWPLPPNAPDTPDTMGASEAPEAPVFSDDPYAADKLRDRRRDEPGLHAEAGPRPEAGMRAGTVSRPEAGMRAGTVSRPEAGMRAGTVSRPEAGMRAETVSRPEAGMRAEAVSHSEAGLGTGPAARSGPGPGPRADQVGTAPEAERRPDEAGSSPGPGMHTEAGRDPGADGPAEPGAGPDPGVPTEPVVRPDPDVRAGPPVRAEPGVRAEIGWPRDEAWATAVRSLARGLAVAVDYAHFREDRPPFGTLTGYLDGREARPVPDGSRDITAHVAIDACAAAGAHAAARPTTHERPGHPAPHQETRTAGTARDGATDRDCGDGGDRDGMRGGKSSRNSRNSRSDNGSRGSDSSRSDNGSREIGIGRGNDGGRGGDGSRNRDGRGAGCAAPALRSQRDALHSLGIDGARPPLSLASSDPPAYVRQLAAAGEAAELTGREGLGAFMWLVQPVGGVPSPFGWEP